MNSVLAWVFFQFPVYVTLFLLFFFRVRVLSFVIAPVHSVRSYLFGFVSYLQDLIQPKANPNPSRTTTLYGGDGVRPAPIGLGAPLWA
jgi:hypothetical protein